MYGRDTPDELLIMARKCLEVDGYSIVPDCAVGVCDEDRLRISQEYFETGALEADLPAIHPDRRRSRDVLRYYRQSAHIKISENPTVTIVNRSGHSAPRTPRRVRTVFDGTLRRMVESMLDCIPAERQHESGTFGLNFFQTRTNVVSKPHRDDEDFCIVYVLAICGSGAETSLFDIDNPNRVVLRHSLKAGEILIFDDKRFLHYTSPIEGSQSRYRNALICTVDNHDTYFDVDLC